MEASALPWFVLIIVMCVIMVCTSIVDEGCDPGRQDGFIARIQRDTATAPVQVQQIVGGAAENGVEMKLYCGVPASFLRRLISSLINLPLLCALPGVVLMFIREEASIQGETIAVTSMILLGCGVCCGLCCGSLGVIGMHKDAKKGLKDAVTASDSAVMQMLSDGTIRLLSCAWLLSHPLTVLRRLQDLPEEAFLPNEAAANSFKNGCVYVLSYGWATREHPDPEGVVLQRVIQFLSSSWASGFPNFAPSSFGLFWDFACLPQEPRSQEENTRFKAALSIMSKMYGSLFFTSVIQVTSLPLDLPPYNQRGWCIAEEGAACTAAFYGARSSSMPPKLIDITGSEPQPHVPSAAPSIDALEQRIDRAVFTSEKDDKQKVLTQTKEFITMLSLGGKVTNCADVIGQPASDLRV